MSADVYIERMARSEQGQIAAVVVIKPSNTTRFHIKFEFADKGNDENNIHHIQGELQRFSQSLAEALRRPLKRA